MPPQLADSRTIVEILLDEAYRSEALPDEAKLLVHAATEGEHALDELLENASATAGTWPADRTLRERPPENPAYAYLRSITVRGFRGIGPEATLDLEPGPGLTIVAGRNGSGKSTFFEALELALTGETYRWKNKSSSLSKDRWRNLHDGKPSYLEIKLAEQGVGTTVVRTEWNDEDERDAHHTWLQRPGQRREPGRAGLGWTQVLELYRPLLSYDELGNLFSMKQSELHDRLSSFVGTEQADEAKELLRAKVSSSKKPATKAKQEAKTLADDLGKVDDARARQAVDLLRKHPADLPTLRAIATGTSTVADPMLDALRRLGSLAVPEANRVHEAATRLREATAEMRRLGPVPANAVADRRDALLREALVFHQDAGDGPCPVCDTGGLDATWRERVELELADRERSATERRTAARRRDEAKATAQRLLESVDPPDASELPVLSSLEAARAAYGRWTGLDLDDGSVTENMPIMHAELAEAFCALRAEAENALAKREDAWIPLASRLAHWVETAQWARDREPRLKMLEAAQRFVDEAVTRYKNAEIQQINVKAREIWAVLRQESNVALSRIELTGQRTHRKVDLHAAVDGSDSHALSVMSQGEVHALALALFLPRATVDASPFRFIVLDDPIQAMDPAKVDGFAQVLEELARSRQVVVFSHDDRLPQAIRHLGLRARIVEVIRAANSKVSVENSEDPVTRQLNDAHAIACDRAVPGEIQERVIPRICREAVEAAGYQIYLTRELLAGNDRDTIAKTWESTRKTKARLALAVFRADSKRLESWVQQRPERAAIFGLVTRGPHASVPEVRQDPRGTVDNVRRLIDDLRRQSP